MQKCSDRLKNTKGTVINPVVPRPKSLGVDVRNQLNASEMTFSLQSPGDEQYDNGKAPRSCRDITNLSCFGFSYSLTAGAHRRIFSHSVGQNCLALLSFQLFKRSHKEKDEGEKIPSPTLHRRGEPLRCLSCLIK